MALVKKRVYRRCMVACSMPPVYWSTGVHCSTSGPLIGAAVFVRDSDYHWYWYQEESTNVSIVSVSRSAGPPH